MLTTFKPALIITYREIRDQLRDWRIIAPVAILTLFFPGLLNFTANYIVSFVEQYGANIIAQRFIPFLLMIVGFFPITVSLVIALESFVGETERHSIEPLLSTPVEDWQLYFGKLLASLLPPLAASYLGIVVYMIAMYREAKWTPEPSFLVQILILTAVQALVMVSGAVVISTQTTSVRAANLLSSFIIIPMALLIQGESALMLWTDYSTLWWAIIGQVVIACMLVRMGIAHFNREDLLGRELDSLNIRWGWRIFKGAFTGQARTLREWYTNEIAKSLRRLGLPILLMSALLVAGMWLGADLVRRLGLPPEILNIDQIQNLKPDYLDQMREFGFFSVGGVSLIWLHNLRAIALAFLAGIFTFGVAGVLILITPLTLIGFFAGFGILLDISPWTFLGAFTLPHGLLEIPAIILSGAAILRVGATLVTPNRSLTIGEAWIRAMADWAKITLALIIPLFLGAAILEVFLSPRFVLMFLGSG